METENKRVRTNIVIQKNLGKVGSGSANIIINKELLTQLGWEPRSKVQLRQRGAALLIEFVPTPVFEDGPTFDDE